MINACDNLCIGLCVWNGESTIKKTILSLLNQNYKNNIKIIILDNRSDDRTVRIIKELKNNNKKKNIIIKLVIDKKKRNVVAAQNYLAKKYFLKFDFSMFVMDDDIYHKNFVNTVIKRLKKKNLDLVYTNYMKIDSDTKKIIARNKPLYSYTISKFYNLANYIIYRNINPIFFGIYRTKSLLELIEYYNHFDSSKSNHDNLLIFNFLLKKKVDVIKKNYFFFLEKDRNKIEKIRETGPSYWKLSSLFTIFIYQFNFSTRMINLLVKSNQISLLKKILLFSLISIIYFQKTLSYVTKRLFI
jgi:glycosyltransferase involved in cell wall biosynthesis